MSNDAGKAQPQHNRAMPAHVGPFTIADALSFVTAAIYFYQPGVNRGAVIQVSIVGSSRPSYSSYSIVIVIIQCCQHSSSLIYAYVVNSG
jgi:hypothetical protein